MRKTENDELLKINMRQLEVDEGRVAPEARWDGWPDGEPVVALIEAVRAEWFARSLIDVEADSA